MIFDSPNPTVVCAQLREAASAAPTDDLRNRVEALLHSKFESVQSVAGQTLAAWRVPQSLPSLLAWFDRVSNADASRISIRHVAGHCIAAFASADTAVALVRYFVQSRPNVRRYEFLPVFKSLSGKDAESTMIEAWAIADRELKQALLQAANEMGVNNLPTLVALGESDADSCIREFTEVLLAKRRTVEWLQKWIAPAQKPQNPTKRHAH